MDVATGKTKIRLIRKGTIISKKRHRNRFPGRFNNDIKYSFKEENASKRVFSNAWGSRWFVKCDTVEKFLEKVKIDAGEEEIDAGEED